MNNKKVEYENKAGNEKCEEPLRREARSGSMCFGIVYAHFSMCMYTT